MPKTFLLVALCLVGVLCTVADAAEVSIDSDRMMVVNGKRTFVLGNYNNPDDDTALDTIAQAGFNIIRCKCDPVALDRIHARGLYAWINTGGKIDLGPDGQGAADGLQEMVQTCGSHPALMVWEVPDEALWGCWLDAWRGPGTILERVRRFRDLADAKCAGMVAGYQALKALDPQRPVWINHAAMNAFADLEAYNEAADIVGCDIYPLLPYPTSPIDISRSVLSDVGLHTTRMQRTAPEKPVWMVLQGMGWSETGDLFTAREYPGQRPNYHETRFMAYDAIARGARGILYWGTHLIEPDSDLWQAILQVVRELADLQDVIAAPDTALQPQVTARYILYSLNDWVRVLGKEVNGETWWIVVNELPVALSFSVSNLASLDGVAYADMRTGAALAVKNGKIEGAIQPYDVFVLKPAAAIP